MGEWNHGRLDFGYERSLFDRLESHKHDGAIWDDGRVDNPIDVFGI